MERRRGCCRDWTSNNQEVRACAQSIRGSHHPSLVIDASIRWPHSWGDDRERVAKLASQGCDLQWTANDAAQTTPSAERDKFQHLLFRSPSDADLVELIIVHTRKHGHTKDE